MSPLPDDLGGSRGLLVAGGAGGAGWRGAGGAGWRGAGGAGPGGRGRRSRPSMGGPPSRDGTMGG